MRTLQNQILDKLSIDEAVANHSDVLYSCVIKLCSPYATSDRREGLAPASRVGIRDKTTGRLGAIIIYSRGAGLARGGYLEATRIIG